jgi:hypothetical protein
VCRVPVDHAIHEYTTFSDNFSYVSHIYYIHKRGLWVSAGVRLCEFQLRKQQTPGCIIIYIYKSTSACASIIYRYSNNLCMYVYVDLCVCVCVYRSRIAGERDLYDVVFMTIEQMDSGFMYTSPSPFHDVQAARISLWIISWRKGRARKGRKKYGGGVKAATETNGSEGETTNSSVRACI